MVNRLNSRLKKEETSKRMRLKILQRAFNDSMKDKQRLIVNLQVCTILVLESARCSMADSGVARNLKGGVVREMSHESH